MTLSACQVLVRDTLNDIPSPGYANVQALIAPLIPGTLKGSVPQAYVWGSRGNEKRHSGGRRSNVIGLNTGFKRADHTLNVWLIAVGPNTSDDQDTQFPTLIDTCKAALRAVVMPLTLTDPTTGEVSQCWSVGEDFQWEYDIDRTLADQRYVRHLCLIECSVSEDFEG